jgi:hypothetical protein
MNEEIIRNRLNLNNDVEQPLLVKDEEDNKQYDKYKQKKESIFNNKYMITLTIFSLIIYGVIIYTVIVLK